MPNKDSFTFSDKLRKSKSVPLSKRLPSIVGGQNKQKRTLVQRAQRDLPFILVAACALLLLPFLSKTGSDDIAGSGDFQWNPAQEEQPFFDNGDRDIMPAGGMQDPLDLILRPRSSVDTVSPEEPSKDSYGSDRSSRSSYDSRRSYDDSYSKQTSSPSATSKFAKSTRPQVRKSLERKGTDINRALRLSQIASAKGGTSTSHALPTGQAPARTPSGSTITPGVRPVALQGMEAKGTVGRSMTGENLYAEAARSISAMNAGGPAKSNLLAAQMKDVDGKMADFATSPGGSFGSAGSARPGAGGSMPPWSNAYNIGKPWWWDMMQARAQKWWDLFQYKPREMFWNNIYNYGSQIMNCLATGNSKGDVSTMFGKKAGADDMICSGADMMSLKDYLDEFGGSRTSTNKDGGSETSTNSDTALQQWYKDCEAAKGSPKKKEGKRKSAWKVRRECLGIDFGRFKDWTKKEYHQNCENVTVDGIQGYSVKVTNEKGKTRELLTDKTVIALIAKHNKTGKEYVVYAENSNVLTQAGKDVAATFNGKYSDCTITEVISFVSKSGKNSIIRDIERYKSDQEKKVTNLPPGTRAVATNENLSYNDSDSPEHLVLVEQSGKINAAQKICQGGKASNALTLDDLKDELDPKKNSYNSCPIPSPREIVKTMYLQDKPCYSYPYVYTAIDKSAEAEAVIENPAGKYVYAVLVEELNEMAKTTVRGIREYGLVSKKEAEEYGRQHKGYSYDKKGFHFYYEPNLAVEGSAAEYGKKGPIDSNGSGSVRGKGKVLWIVTSDKRLSKAVGTVLDLAIDQVSPADFTSDYVNSGICSYRWCNEVAGCKAEDENIYCKYNKGKNYLDNNQADTGEIDEYFEAIRVDDAYLRVSTIPVTGNEKLKELYRDIAIPDCTPMGLHKEGKVEWIYKIKSYDPAAPVYTDEKNNAYSKWKEYSGFKNLLQKSHHKEGILPNLDKNSGKKYCKYNNAAYECSIVDNMYVRTSETPADGVSIEDLNDCTPVAWYDENYMVFELEQNVDQLPISSKQTGDMTQVTTADQKQVKVTKINRHRNAQVFKDLKEQALVSDNPSMFKLFPKIVLERSWDMLSQGDTSVQNICEQASKKVIFKKGMNNQLELTGDKNSLVKDLDSCLQSAIETAQASNKDCELYLNGYASSACTEQSQDICLAKNLALSIDRTRFYVDDILSKSSYIKDVSIQDDIDDRGLQRFATAPKYIMKTRANGRKCTIILNAAGQEDASDEESLERFVILSTQKGNRRADFDKATALIYNGSSTENIS